MYLSCTRHKYIIASLFALIYHDEFAQNETYNENDANNPHNGFNFLMLSIQIRDRTTWNTNYLKNDVLIFPR